MADTRRRLGQRGEDFVSEWLRQRGYTLLDRNWRHISGELDIVAQHGDEIVFVEVRTRRGPLQAAIDAALESITPRKQARLAALAQHYLAAHAVDSEHITWRIDVAAVGCEEGRFSMELISDAIDW
jgi:putative endonuclease